MLLVTETGRYTIGWHC